MIHCKCVFFTSQEFYRGSDPDPHYKPACGIRSNKTVNDAGQCECEELRRSKLAEQVDWTTIDTAA
jgi:hypothetical protein